MKMDMAKLDRLGQILLRIAGGNAAVRADAGEFNEEDHPRAKDGKFGSGGGSGAAATPSAPKDKPATGAKAVAKEKASPRQEAASTVPTTGRAANHVATKVVDGKRTLADGTPLPPHVAAAKIPPNWQSVTVNPDPKADLIAAGKDAKGRPTAIYSADFVAKQQAQKFARVQSLDKSFAGIKAKNDAAMTSDDPKVRAAADCTDLIMKMGLRPGSDSDTGAKVKAYGASNLLGEHVVQDGDDVRLRFVGKKGVNLNLPVGDPGLKAMLVQRSQEAGAGGRIFGNMTETRLGEHVKAIGGKFKTKDFRTLLATRTAAEMVKPPPPTSEKEYQAKAMEVAKAVSAKLGNTPVVALQSYINPAVFAEWRAAVATPGARADAAQDDKPAEFPDAHFGTADTPLPEWDEDDTPDDDEELAKNPPGLVEMLGFDPKRAVSQIRADTSTKLDAIADRLSKIRR